ncbi:hypothetical protein M413DRAFT_442265 [Hebeloma cylindrosporum]|uniref:Uncharacterized protein n=1 Tax=Hebeloma cylindrosporum TaxID=76867 RepID=A0A0C3C9Z0_HEBCY|nr:hypothetical protein M413DRAFT_442265 [Hebeloma cylindrosporum h7]
MHSSFSPFAGLLLLLGSVAAAPVPNHPPASVHNAPIPAGAYRIASINSAANHQPVIVPVAQRGSLDGTTYFAAHGHPPAQGVHNAHPPPRRH